MIKPLEIPFAVVTLQRSLSQHPSQRSVVLLSTYIWNCKRRTVGCSSTGRQIMMPNSNFRLSAQPLTQFTQESQQHPPALTSQEEALLSHNKKLPYISEYKDYVIWEGEEKGDAKMRGWKMRNGCFGDWNVSRSTFVYIHGIHSPNWIHYPSKMADKLQQNIITDKLSGKSLQQLKPV